MNFEKLSASDKALCILFLLLKFTSIILWINSDKDSPLSWVVIIIYIFVIDIRFQETLKKQQ